MWQGKSLVGGFVPTSSRREVVEWVTASSAQATQVLALDNESRIIKRPTPCRQLGYYRLVLSSSILFAVCTHCDKERVRGDYVPAERTIHHSNISTRAELTPSSVLTLLSSSSIRVSACTEVSQVDL